MSERILVRKIEPNLWQWRAVTAQQEWASEAFYTGDINLLKESIEGRHVWLIVPGQNVVSQRAEATVKDRRQLLKLLPFEVEEGVISAVEDLHFSYGAIENDKIPLAYADLEWLRECIAEIEDIGGAVQRCGVDYLQLRRPDDGWTLLLENNILYAHFAKDVGFAVEQEMAAAYLKSLAATESPASLRLYADDERALQALRALLPDRLTQQEGLVIEEREAGFWDVTSPSAALRGEFRSGRLARKLPFDKWWNEFKYPLIAMAAAFVVAIGATWFALQQAESERREIMAQTDEIFRQAVPAGSISDPERQLRAMVGGSSNSGAGSNAVVLIAGVAPALNSFDEVSVRSMRYSAESGQLQLNVEANSFATFEALRVKIAEAGLNVDIKSANVYGETHQAQLRVSEAG